MSSINSISSTSSAFTLKGSKGSSESLLILRTKAKIYSVFKNMEDLSEKEKNTFLTVYGIFSSYHSLYKRMQYLSDKANNYNGKLSPEEREEITDYFFVAEKVLQYIYIKIYFPKNQSYSLNFSESQKLSSIALDLEEGLDMLMQNVETCNSYIEKIRDEKSKKEKDEAEAKIKAESKVNSSCLLS